MPRQINDALWRSTPPWRDQGIVLFHGVDAGGMAVASPLLTVMNLIQWPLATSDRFRLLLRSPLGYPAWVERWLILCSRNQWRSPTAERLAVREMGVLARSRGLATSARRVVGAADLGWATRTFVMEHHHRAQLREHFPREWGTRPVVVLGIKDRYKADDPALIRLLRQKLQPFVAPQPGACLPQKGEGAAGGGGKLKE